MKYCGICNRKIGGKFDSDIEENWQIHLVGIKHQQNVIYNEESKRTVMVTGVVASINNQDLKAYFSKFGEVISSNKMRFLARILYKNKADMEAAIAYQNHMICGHQVNVNLYSGLCQYASYCMPRYQVAKRWQNRIDKQYRVLLNEDIEAQILGLLTEVELDEEGKKERKEYVDFLQTFFQSYIPEVRLYQFGSSMTGLGFQDCNLNMMMDLDPQRGKEIRKNPQAPPGELPDLSFLPKLQVEAGRVTLDSLVNMTIGEQMCFFILLLEESKERYGIIKYQPLFDARQPILRMFHNSKNWEMSLSFGDKLAAYNTHLMRLLLQIDGRFGILSHIIKFWAWQVGVCYELDSQALSSYSLTLMVYFYLENTSPPILPRVKDLCELGEKFPLFKSTRGTVAGWKITICEDVDYINRMLLPEKNLQTIPELLKGFFDFYASMDLLNVVICPRSGLAIGTIMFKQMMKTNENLCNFQIKDLSIQEPFNLGCNTAESLTPDAARKRISIEFCKAAETIERAGEGWTLADILPEDPVLNIEGQPHRDVTRTQPQMGGIQIHFRPALLPELFVQNYSSTDEISSQWFQWIVELTMQCLGAMRIDYQVAEGFAKDDVTMMDLEYIAHTDPLAVVGNTRFSATEQLKEEVILVCKSHAKVLMSGWIRTLNLGIKENNIDVSTADKLIAYAEKVTEMLIPDEEPETEPDNPTVHCIIVCRMLTIGHNTFAKFLYKNVEDLIKQRLTVIKCLHYFVPKVLTLALNQDEEDDNTEES